jgi:hypothetical protein
MVSSVLMRSKPMPCQVDSWHSTMKVEVSSSKGCEAVGVGVAQPAVDAVAGDHQVGVGEVTLVLELGLEAQVDAELRATPVQQLQQPPARDAGEAVATGGDAAALEVDVDVVPVSELGEDRVGTHRVVGAEVVERLVGEDHAPAEGVVGSVALDHDHLVRRVAQLHRDGEVEPCRAAAKAGDLHRSDARVPCMDNNLDRRPIVFNLKYSSNKLLRGNMPRRRA